MPKKTIDPPDFSDYDVRVELPEEDEVYIVATDEGLAYLQELISKLRRMRFENHIHCDDRNLLTRDSLRLTFFKYPTPEFENDMEPSREPNSGRKGIVRRLRDWFFLE